MHENSKQMWKNIKRLVQATATTEQLEFLEQHGVSIDYITHKYYQPEAVGKNNLVEIINTALGYNVFDVVSAEGVKQ